MSPPRPRDVAWFDAEMVSARRGDEDAEIAWSPELTARLQVSVGTLKIYFLHLSTKLDVHNRVQAARCARRWREEEKIM